MQIIIYINTNNNIIIIKVNAISLTLNILYT